MMSLDAGQEAGKKVMHAVLNHWISLQKMTPDQPAASSHQTLSGKRTAGIRSVTRRCCFHGAHRTQQ